MLNIAWRGQAQDDLLEILSYIGERDERAAERLYGLIEHGLEHAAQHPFLYKISQRIAGTREIVVHPNYIVLYQVTHSAVDVISVVHARREYPQ
jgi:toxin ParE1/3/4